MDWEPRYLTKKQTLVLEYILEYKEKYGVVFPRQSDIANDLGIRTATVNEAIKRLEKLKYIVRERRKDNSYKCGRFFHEVCKK